MKLLLPVLKINARWQPLEIIDVRRAFEDAFAGAAAFILFKDNFPIITKIDEWINLTPQPHEDFVQTGLRKILIPRVIISLNYNNYPLKEQRPNLKNLAKHYNETCAVSGKKLKPEEYSREHVRPRSKGGNDGWTNEVLMDRNLNSLRSNKSYRKVGLKKPTILPAPKPLLPINVIVNRHGYKEWDLFKIPRK